MRKKKEEEEEIKKVLISIMFIKTQTNISHRNLKWETGLIYQRCMNMYEEFSC